MSSVSIITASLNDGRVERALQSVDRQTVSCEHVVVDGGSRREVVEKILRALNARRLLIVEKDAGIYDAINKGIRKATGSIVGILHADDVFAACDVIERVKQVFQERNADVVYGDVRYVTPSGRTVRLWRAGTYTRRSFMAGWMPPHPGLFVRRSLFESEGLYSPAYRISGDYEFVLRLFGMKGLRIVYAPMVITDMTVGGASNGNLLGILAKMREDVRAMRQHGLNPWITLPAKNLRKIIQFVSR